MRELLGRDAAARIAHADLDAAATILAPTYEALRQHVQAAPVIGADETWWRVLVGPGDKRWWAWSLTSAAAVTYTILESRSQEAARRVLNGYQGIVVADGYSAYDVDGREKARESERAGLEERGRCGDG